MKDYFSFNITFLLYKHDQTKINMNYANLFYSIKRISKRITQGDSGVISLALYMIVSANQAFSSFPDWRKLDKLLMREVRVNPRNYRCFATRLRAALFDPQNHHATL